MNWMSENHRWEEYDKTEEVGQSMLDLQINKNKNMNGIGKLSWVNCKSALVYGLVIGLLAMSGYAISVGDIWALDWKILVNTGFFAILGSLVKNILTTNSGNFVGLVKTVE